MEYSRIAFLIPAYNEEKTIAKVMKSLPNGVSVIVVDDGSSDRTLEMAKKNQAQIIRNHTNQGYEKSLLLGFRHVLAENKYDAVITLDADGEHDPSYIFELLKHFHQGADIVIGIRHKFNRISETHASNLFNFMYAIKDPLCGMRIYSTKFLYEYLEEYKKLYLGTLPLKFAVKNKYSTKQIEMRVNKRQDRSRFGSSFKGNIRIYCVVFLCILQVVVRRKVIYH